MVAAPAGRLRDGRAIGDVLRGRRKHVAPRLVVHVSDRGDAEPSRIAVVASRRVGGAVQRNRAKRLLREAARLRSWPSGLDVVLIARAACVRSDLAEVTNDLDTAVRVLGLRPSATEDTVPFVGTAP